VARHEPVSVLDQRPQKAAFGGADIRWRLDDYRIGVCEDPRRRTEPAGKPIRDVSAVSGPALGAKRIQGIRDRRGRKHDDSVWDCPPASRLDPR
jgi:hypothetical protein